jgi:hypothetical protein
VRKALADVRPRLVDRTLVAVQEDAAGLLLALQDAALLIALDGILGEEASRRDSHVARKSLDIALRDLDSRDLAAVRAYGAVDLVLDAFRDPAEDAVGVIPRLQEAAEPHVLVPLLLAERLDLDQVGDHAGSFSRTRRA